MARRLHIDLMPQGEEVAMERSPSAPDADAHTGARAELGPEGGAELTEEQKRQNVIHLAFGDDPSRFETFVDLLRRAIPPGTGAVLRGSAVTGYRWSDRAPFDADGAGTSDLDLTLIGEEVLALFKVTGFFVPGIHSRPISEEDPEIAPDLIPLRQQLIAMASRPVNIQATRDFVMYLRGDLLGQPYLTLIERPEHA